MCSASGCAALPALGFPIRESAGQRLFSASPRLFAAVHALHRLQVPRHPPCALTILTVIGTGLSTGPVIPMRPLAVNAIRPLIFDVTTVQFSRAAEAWRRTGAHGLSKLNSMSASCGAVCPAGPARSGRHSRLGDRDLRAVSGLNGNSHESARLSRGRHSGRPCAAVRFHRGSRRSSLERR